MHIMSNLHTSGEETSLGNSAVLRHEIEEKHLRTVGNINSKGVQVSTTTTNTKISLISTAQRKSFVSSVSMSLERKDSIQYIPRKPPCIISGDQNTFIHIDNYTHVMAQHVTTKTIKRARPEITADNSVVPCSTNSPKSKLVDDTVDVNLKVVLNGVDSSYSSNNKALKMNKQKVQELKSNTPVKIRGRKKSMDDHKNSKDRNKLIDIKIRKPDIATKIKPIVKKTANRRKKVIKAIKARTPKIKLKSEVKQQVKNSEEKGEPTHKSPSTLRENESKILRPCVYIMQNKKCLSEVKCLYLHSDFPCKYYYLNIPCPKGLNCQFMHNGNLEPQLEEALRNHILELLSPNPSIVETHFVEQMHYIENLSRRLQSFPNNKTNNEVIEVVDDGDEDLIVVEESSNDSNNHHVEHDVMNPQTTINDLDTIYASIKETNSTVDEIGIKLKLLKSRTNIMPNEKMLELQNIYSLLKEQERRLKLYGKLNTTATNTEIKTIDDTSSKQNLTLSLLSNMDDDQTHVVLVNPSIVNEIRRSENFTDNETIMTIAEPATKSEVSNNVGTEFLTNEEENVINLSDDENAESEIAHQCSQASNSNVTKRLSIEVINNENLPRLDTSDNNEMVNFSKDRVIKDLNVSSNVDCEEEPITSTESVCYNSNLNLNENFEKSEIINKDTKILSAKRHENNQLETKQIECDAFKTMNEEILENKNNFVDLDENVNSIERNEAHEIEITNNEQKVIEKTTKQDHMQSEEMQEKSSYKFEKRCLRSHAMQDNEETPNEMDGKKLTAKTPERIKPYRTRRLRLPKPSKKTPQKSNLDECDNNGKVFDKLIKPTEANSQEEKLMQNVESPLAQNVILSKRFMKRVKTKLEQQSLSHEMTASDCSNRIATNVEKELLKLHSAHIESFNENNDDNNSLNLSQYHLKFATDDLEINSDSPISNDNFNSFKLHLDTQKIETVTNANVNRRISFETPSSSLAVLSSNHIKEKFSLGNPHVVLTKLKTPFNQQTTQKDIQADSTTSQVNATATSSIPLAGGKFKQKRRILTAEYDSDSFPEETKCLKIENSKSARKVKIDESKRTLSQQSYDSKDEDFETESSDEKLTMESSYNSSEREETFESCSTREQQQHHHTHQYEHKEQQENESDLRQQIENVGNKSDLQLQIQCQEQQRFQQQKEVSETSTAIAATSLIAKNNKTLPHIQQQEQKRALDDEKRDTKDLLHRQQYDDNETEDGEITNSINSCDSIENYEDGRAQSFACARIDKPEKPSSNSASKYANETTFTGQDEDEADIGCSSPSLFNKLSNHSIKRQITFEKSAVNITPISSPTYDDDTIASPSPTRKSINFRLGGEVDGRLTYPPMPYILQEIDLGKIDVNKPQFIDKLKKTIQLDPRVFKKHLKKPLAILSKTAETTSNALLQNITSNTFNFTSTHQPSSALTQATASMISPYDPRNRTSATMTDIETSTLSHETAVTLYNNRQTAAATSSSSTSSALSSSFYHTLIPNSVPLALQYNGTSQPIIQPQQPQTLNMFLYGCLQRSSWYQSLMSTMKIQINQSISQLVRALNSFHRERVFNPELIFDIFKIDCAGEVLEIMRNLGIFVDANGIINEHRHVPSPAGHTCCNELPINPAYSFIQQFLTPNNAAAGTAVGQLNVNEPILSCYVRAPEPVPKQSDECVPANQPQQDCKNCIKQCNDNRNDNNYNNNNYNNQNNNRRYGNHFKKPYDNSTNNNNGNNNYQQRSNHRSSYNSNYNNNPRFMKPGSSSPKRFNSSPTNSPRKSYDGGSRGGRGGGGRFNNNNKRFNNYNNNDNNNDDVGSSFASLAGSKENSYNTAPKTSSPPPENSVPKSSKPSSADEECWDSDN